MGKNKNWIENKVDYYVNEKEILVCFTRPENIVRKSKGAENTVS